MLDFGGLLPLLLHPSSEIRVSTLLLAKRLTESTGNDIPSHFLRHYKPSLSHREYWGSLF